MGQSTLSQLFKVDTIQRNLWCIYRIYLVTDREVKLKSDIGKMREKKTECSNAYSYTSHWLVTVWTLNWATVCKTQTLLPSVISWLTWNHIFIGSCWINHRYYIYFCSSHYLFGEICLLSHWNVRSQHTDRHTVKHEFQNHQCYS